MIGQDSNRLFEARAREEDSKKERERVTTSPDGLSATKSTISFPRKAGIAGWTPRNAKRVSSPFFDSRRVSIGARVRQQRTLGRRPRISEFIVIYSHRLWVYQLRYSVIPVGKGQLLLPHRVQLIG